MPAITVYSSLASVQLYSAVVCTRNVNIASPLSAAPAAVQMVAAPTAAAHQLSRVQTLALDTSPNT